MTLPLQLPSIWFSLLGATNATPEMANSIFLDLNQRYSEPHRHYHTLDHVFAMWTCLRNLDEKATLLPPLQLAVWYHDVIYDTHAADNEERSALHARGQLQSVGIADDIL